MIQDKDYLTVKDVAEMLDTEAYVLRFYEKELNLDIKRNAKGHRVYTLEDVEMFRKIQDMREQGLQLKAIETIVHDSSEEAKETYEQLSSLNITAVAPVKNKGIVEVDITNAEDEKIKQFSYLMKDMFKQAITECNEANRVEIEETIKKEVDTVVDEKVSRMQELQDAKNEDYYRKLDEAMREVQKIRKEMIESKEEPVKEKKGLFKRFFKDKSQSIEM